MCSDYKTHTSHITEEKLALLTSIPERTIRRSIKRLKESGLLHVRTVFADGCKRRNSYHFAPADTNFSIIENNFFHKGYDPRIAGFMLLLKAITLNNSDVIL